MPRNTQIPASSCPWSTPAVVRVTPSKVPPHACTALVRGPASKAKVEAVSEKIKERPKPHPALPPQVCHGYCGQSDCCDWSVSARPDADRRPPGGPPRVDDRRRGLDDDHVRGRCSRAVWLGRKPVGDDG